MIFRRFLTIAALAACIRRWPWPRPRSPPADEALLKAYDAFRAGDAVKLQRYSAQVGSAHLLCALPRVLAPQAAPGGHARRRRAAFPRAGGGQLSRRPAARGLAEGARQARRLAGVRARAAAAGAGRPGDPLLRAGLRAWRASDEEAHTRRRAPSGSSRASCRRAAVRSPTACSRTQKVQRGRRLAARARAVRERRAGRRAPRARATCPPANKHDEALLNQAATAPKKLLASPPKNLEPRATREMVLFAVIRLGAQRSGGRGGGPARQARRSACRRRT